MVNFFCKTIYIGLLISPLILTRPIEETNLVEWYNADITIELFNNGSLNDVVDSNIFRETIVNESIVHPVVRLTENQPTNNIARSKVGGCGAKCKRRMENSELLRKKEVEKNILEALNLSKPPKISPENMLTIDSAPVREVLEQNLDEDEIQHIYGIHKEPKTRMLLSLAKQPKWAVGSTENIFYFNLTGENREGFDVDKASLSFYVIPGNYSGSQIAVTLSVFRRRDVSLRKQMNITTENINITGIPSEGGWANISVNVLKELVKGWLEISNSSLGLQLYSAPNIIVSGFAPNQNNYRSILKVKFTETKKRSKRSATPNYCNANSNNTSCCLYNFTIDFHRQGWTFVIHPRTYQANYCAGHCSPVQFRQSVHNSLVQSQQNKTKANWKIPCCVGKEYAPINLLYYDEQQNVVYSTVPDMQITRCGCA